MCHELLITDKVSELGREGARFESRLAARRSSHLVRVADRCLSLPRNNSQSTDEVFKPQLPLRGVLCLN